MLHPVASSRHGRPDYWGLAVLWIKCELLERNAESMNGMVERPAAY